VRLTARPAEQLEAAAPRRRAADPRRLSGSDRDRGSRFVRRARRLGVHQPGKARNNSGGRARTGTRLSAARLRGPRRGRSRPPAGRWQRQRGSRRARVRSPALHRGLPGEPAGDTADTRLGAAGRPPPATRTCSTTRVPSPWPGEKCRSAGRCWRKRTGSASGPRSPCPPGSGPEPAPGPGPTNETPGPANLSVSLR